LTWELLKDGWNPPPGEPRPEPPPRAPDAYECEYCEDTKVFEVSNYPESRSYETHDPCPYCDHDNPMIDIHELEVENQKLKVALKTFLTGSLDIVGYLGKCTHEPLEDLTARVMDLLGERLLEELLTEVKDD